MSEKPLSERTKALRKATVEYMRREYPELDLTDAEMVVEYLQILNKKPATIRIALSSLIEHHKEEGKIDLTAFRKAYKDITISMTEQAKKQSKEGKEKKTLEWMKVLETAVKIQDDPHIPEMAKMLVSFYTEMVPVRNDYSFLCICFSAPAMPEVGNYIVINDTECYVRINNHKTAKEAGPLIRYVPDGLKARIQKWVDQYYICGKSEFLFPIREATISKWIGNAFFKHSGQRTTINSLRHSYISEFRKGEKSLLEKEALAKEMGHGLLLQELYREL